MGLIYQHIEDFVKDIEEDEVILEIGSDRWEGSTAYLAAMAHLYNSHLHTVDVNPDSARRLKRLLTYPLDTCYTFHENTGESLTSMWSVVTGGKTIRVLYLDNFDWDWEVGTNGDMITEQKAWYLKQGLEMTNINSQVSHLTQAINLTPWFTRKSIIAIDDTYLYNGIFIGKGGAVVPYLMTQGFDVIKIHDNGVILGCDFENTIV
jgi:hypothetical protein